MGSNAGAEVWSEGGLREGMVREDAYQSQQKRKYGSISSFRTILLRLYCAFLQNMLLKKAHVPNK